MPENTDEPWADRLRQHAAVGSSFEDVQRDPVMEAAQTYPDLYRQRYGRAQQDTELERQRRSLEGAEESNWTYIRRRALPFASAIGNYLDARSYGQARDRYQRGEASQGDLSIIAQYERLQHLDQNQSLGQQIQSGLAHIPALVGEAAVGGAVLGRLAGPGAAAAGRLGTEAAPSLGARAASYLGRQAAMTPLMPSMYLNEAAQRNLEQGRNVADPRGFAPALITGVMQNAVLGSLGFAGNSITQKGVFGAASRILARTATGLAEQHLFVEPLAEAISQALPEAYRLQTGHGLLMNALTGKWGDAWKQFAVSSVTFAAFSGLHEAQHGAPSAKKMLDAQGKLMEFMAESGLPRDEILGRVQDINRSIKNGTVNLDAVPSGPLRDYILNQTAAMEASKAQEGQLAEMHPQERARLAEQQQIEAQERHRAQLVEAGAWEPPQAPPAPQAPPPKNEPVYRDNIRGTWTWEDRGTRFGQHESGEPTVAGRKNGETYRFEVNHQGEYGILIPKDKNGKPLKDSSFVYMRNADGTFSGHVKVDPAHGGQGLKTAMYDYISRHIGPLTPSEQGPKPAGSGSGFGQTEGGKSFWRSNQTAKLDRLQAEKEAMAKAAAEAREAAHHRGEFYSGTSPEEIKRAAKMDKLRSRKQEATTPDVQTQIDKLKQGKQSAAEARLAARIELEAKIASKAKLAEKYGELRDRITEKQEVAPAERDKFSRDIGLTPQEKKVFWSRWQADAPSFQELANQMGISKGRAEQLEASANEKAGIDVSSARKRLQEKEKAGKLLPGAKEEVEEGKDTEHATSELKTSRERSLRELEDRRDKFHNNFLEILQRAADQGEPISDEHAQALLDLYNQHNKDSKDRRNADFKDIIDDIRESPSVRRKVEETLRIAAERAENGTENAGASRGPGEGQESAGPAEVPPASGEQGGTAPEAATAPRGEAGGNVVESWSQRLAQQEMADPSFKNLIGENQGFVDYGVIAQKAADFAKATYQRIRESVDSIHDALATLGGEIYPRVARASRGAADALARLIAVPEFSRRFAASAIDQIMWKGATPQDRIYAGGTLTEMRLQHIKGYYQSEAQRLLMAGQRAASIGNHTQAREFNTQAAEALEAANGVTSIIGQQDSPFQTPQEFQQAQADPRIQDLIKRYQSVLEPELDQWFRQSKGLDLADPKDTPTQIPGMTVNLLAVDPNAPPAPGIVGTSRGNLRSPKLGTAGFTKQATGSAERYNLDLGAMVESAVSQQAKYGTKQEAYRIFEKEGLGRWGSPGKEEGWTEFKDIAPAKGTQEAQKGQSSFFVKDAAAEDFRKAFAPDAPNKMSALATFNSLMTKAALASTVEAAYHSKNLMTMLMNPGMIPALMGNAWKLLKNKGKFDQEQVQRLVELARTGVSLPGAEQGGSAYNPLTIMGRSLHFLRSFMTLTADQAFTELSKISALKIENTESNRRDFINQLGQYNIRAQNKLVQLARDTGLGPFATAGTNYWVQGLRSLTGNPGIRTESWKGQALLRAWKYSKIAAVAGIAAAANYMLHGRVDGDDNTPLGAVKVGTDKSGKTQYADLVNLTGLTRGLRETGLLALAEGSRQGLSTGAKVDRAFKDALSSAIHPFEGPPAQFAHMFVTGENSLGMRIAPREAESRTLANATTAIQNVNPLVSALGGFNRQPEAQPLTAQERAWQLAGPYGVHTREDVSRFNNVFRDLENQRNLVKHQIEQAKKTGETPPERFAEERRYERMHRAQQEIARIGKRLGGASAEAAQAIRARQNELARRALGG